MTTANVTIIGYCDKTQTEIESLIHAGKTNQLLKLRGEYTIVYEKDNVVVIVTSYVGAMQYCYYYDGNRFSHGRRVIDIIKSIGVAWKWDWESLGDLCELENLTENRTLHKEVKKVPPGTILKFDKKLSIHSNKFIDTIKTDDKGDPVKAIEIFNEETSLWSSQKPYLSLSGGFDSRTILSSMLKQNIYPTLVTLGNEDSTDIEVARMISKKFALEHIIVRLDVNDLLQNGARIAQITNGSKPACHWHTHLYPRTANVPKDESFFVGTLGEFARSYYLDKGIIGLIDIWGKRGQRILWNSKLKRHRTFKKAELDLISTDLRTQINDYGINCRAARNAELSPGGLLSGGTRYYLEQRVPNFYANGISMYNDTTQWRSPFHNINWLETIWNLSDNWKLGSNWHRLAIKRNFPMLLEFPEEKGFARGRMLSKAPPLYWLPVMQRMKYRTYDLSSGWYKDKRVREFILDNRPYLADICKPSLPEKILDDHLQGGDRVRAISFLLTLVYFHGTLRNA